MAGGCGLDFRPCGYADPTDSAFHYNTLPRPGALARLPARTRKSQIDYTRCRHNDYSAGRVESVVSMTQRPCHQRHSETI